VDQRHGRVVQPEYQRRQQGQPEADVCTDTRTVSDRNDAEGISSMKDNLAANDPTMDLEQAAAFLHLGYEAMKALVNKGDVPALSLNQKHTVLLREDLIAYVREEGRKQAEERKRRGRRPAAAPTSRTTQSRNRPALPDLSKYEITTAEPRDPSRAGSHSA